MNNCSKIWINCEWLNRYALSFHEQGTESIEESKKLFFQSNDIKFTTKILTELHKKM